MKPSPAVKGSRCRASDGSAGSPGQDDEALRRQIADAMERSKALVRDAIRLGRASRLTAADLLLVVR